MYLGPKEGVRRKAGRWAGPDTHVTRSPGTGLLGGTEWPQMLSELPLSEPPLGPPGSPLCPESGFSASRLVVSDPHARPLPPLSLAHHTPPCWETEKIPSSGGVLGGEIFWFSEGRRIV